MDPNLIETRMGASTAAGGRAPLALRRAARLLGALPLLGVLAFGAPSAMAQDEAPAEATGPSFRVERIEISFYGGLLGGDTYLALPPLATPLTNDTALDEILDFQGRTPDPPVEAPNKKIESGWKAGGNAAFYLSPNFGMMLFGEYSRQDAVFSGRRVIDEVLQPETEEIDRANMTAIAFGGQVIYHIGRERKHPIRPYVQLGFGGVLNQFPDTDDVGALFFTYGLGLTMPITSTWRAFAGVDSRLFTWETEEVALDSTLLFNGVKLGLTWRYVVPEDATGETGTAD